MNSRQEYAVNAAFSALSEKLGRPIPLITVELVRVLLEAITSSPNPKWGDRTWTELDQGRSEAIGQLPEILDQLAQEEGEDALNPFVAMRWFFADPRRLCPFEY